MNQMVPAQQTMPTVGTRSGQWVWNGTMWCCDPDFDCPPSPCPPCPPPFCPPFPGFIPPPAGQPPWFPGANGGVTFSQTAPPNPVRGAFWWDGTVLWLFDGAAWVKVGGAATTAQTFSLQQMTDLTIPVNTWSIIPYVGTPSIDTQSAWDPATRKLTPKKPGIYTFMARVNETSLAAGALGVIIAKNDAGTVGGTGQPPWVAALVISTGTFTAGLIAADGMVAMNGSTDFVRSWAFATSGTVNYPGSVPVLEAFLMP